MNGEAQRSFSNLLPGTYSLSETLPAGWSASGPVTCSNGSPATNIQLTAGQTVMCVFINLKQNTIVVEKRTEGGDGTFAFTSTPLGPFALTTSNGVASQAFTANAGQPYSISETPQPGWDLTSATCDNGQTPANISLGTGDTVKCTFNNAKRGSLVIAKWIIGTQDASFAFSSSTLTPNAFSLTTTDGFAQQIFSDLKPGTYDATEAATAGYDLLGTLCSNDDTPASVRVAPGEAVICGFFNVQRGGLNIVTNTVGGDGNFGYIGAPTLGSFSVTTSGGTGDTGFPGLSVVTPYGITPTTLEGWNLTSATCDNGETPDDVSLAPAGTVTCTFEYTKLPTPTPIPTLSSWGLLLLGGLVALGASLGRRRRPYGLR